MVTNVPERLGEDQRLRCGVRGQATSPPSCKLDLRTLAILLSSDNRQGAKAAARRSQSTPSRPEPDEDQPRAVRCSGKLEGPDSRRALHTAEPACPPCNVAVAPTKWPRGMRG